MNAQRWQKIDRLFHAAAARPAGERAALLERDCTDPLLRAEIQSLLADIREKRWTESSRSTTPGAPSTLAGDT